MTNVLFGEWGENKNVKRNELTGEGRRDCSSRPRSFEVFSCILPNDPEGIITQNIDDFILPHFNIFRVQINNQTFKANTKKLFFPSALALVTKRV